MTTRKIKIAGAGPSGLTAAINLAKAGFEVDVYEKNSDTGKRFHGDLQGLENWSDDQHIIEEINSMGLDINFDCDPFLELTIANGRHSRTSHYPEEWPICFLVKRGTIPGSLDTGLKEQALAAGVNIHFKQKIPLHEADIVATGTISKEIFAVDKGIIFKTNFQDSNILLVNDDAAYKGYAYLLITKGYGCMCTVLFDKFERLDDNFQTTRRIFQEMLPFDILDEKQVAGVGGFSTQNIYQKGKSLYVGEAAGLQDLMWGFGIRSALRSGHLAAKCLIEGKDYVTEADKYFGSRQKATLTSRFIWEMIRIGNYNLIVNDSFNKGAKKAFDLKLFYRFGKVNRTIYPLALPFMRRRFPKLRI